jgi:hypothetical protein
MANFRDFSTKIPKISKKYGKIAKKMMKIFGNIGYFTYLYYVIVKKI